MGNARTNSLHEALDVETRKAVERDLVEQPPGRTTYREVYEHYGLADKGVSFTSLCRYAGYLRAMARNRWIGELADVVTGKDLAPDIAGLLRTRLFEALLCGETSISELMKASITEGNIAQAQVRREQWEQKREAAKKAVEEAERTKATDPDKSIATLREAVEMVYGIAPKEAGAN